MTFTVTYRDKTGAKREEAIEAVNRDAVFAAMKARDISPLSIREGGRAVAPRPPQSRANDVRNNASVSSKPPYQVGKGDACHNRSKRRVLAVLGTIVLLAILGGGAWWWFDRHAGRVPLPDGATGVRALPNDDSRVARPAPPQSRTIKPAALPITNTPLIVKKGKPTKVENWEREHPAFTNRADRWNTSLPHRIFKNGIDRRIATLFDLKPGETLLGDSRMLFKEDFTKRFLKSLETPIIIAHDDPPEVAELKEAVLETRKELKERYDAGEDIREVMIKTREDMQKLGLYRRELSQQLNKIAADRSLTEAEVNDFVKAANILLEERGAEPLTMPRFAVKRFEILRNREKAGKTEMERKSK